MAWVKEGGSFKCWEPGVKIVRFFQGDSDILVNVTPRFLLLVYGVLLRLSVITEIGFDTGFDHADATSRNKHLPNNVSLRVMYACIHEVEGGHIEAIAWFPIVSHPRILNSLENPTPYVLL